MRADARRSQCVPVLGVAAVLAAVAACGPSFDDSPPSFVEGPTISVVRDTTATIAWITDERANSLIEYGATTDYGTVEIDTLFVTGHAITIKNLEPQTNYHLRAVSYDIFGNGPARSEDFVITTLPPQPPPQVVVSEVMYNPINETAGEFIELYNSGFEDVDLLGFTFTDGDSTDTVRAFVAGASTLLAPGAFALILDSDYVDGTYTIPAGTVLLSTNDTTIGNALTSDDPISLFAPGVSEPSSTYGTPLDLFDAVPITTAPDGSSVERRDLEGIDEAGNWCISVDASGSTPGRPPSACP